MQQLNEWFNEQSQTPAGSVLFGLLIFALRIAIDDYFRRRRARKEAKKKRKAQGA